MPWCSSQIVISINVCPDLNNVMTDTELVYLQLPEAQYQKNLSACIGLKYSSSVLLHRKP